MKKKYQVFISSTYSDLKEERAAVMQCLLEMNCIPVGMEQFPASNMKQMDYIKMMLDDCDYYILILAGRYGTIDVDGIGFTEKEYVYAIEHNIPVMSFVIEDVSRLISGKCETTDEGRKKLEAFRAKVCKGKLIKKYSDIGSLKAAVAVSLNHCIQDYPAAGWVRGAMDPTGQNDMLVLDSGKVSEHKTAYLSENKTGRFTFDYSNNDGKYTIGSGECSFVTAWSKASDKSIHAHKDHLGAGGAIARIKAPQDWPTTIDQDCDFSSKVRTPEIGDVIVWKNSYGKYAATRILDIKDDTRGAEHDELTCEYVIYGETRKDNVVYVEMRNVAGGHTVVIDDEKYIAERVREEHDREIEKLLKEI